MGKMYTFYNDQARNAISINISWECWDWHVATTAHLLSAHLVTETIKDCNNDTTGTLSDPYLFECNLSMYSALLTCIFIKVHINFYFLDSPDDCIQ